MKSPATTAGPDACILDHHLELGGRVIVDVGVQDGVRPALGQPDVTAPGAAEGEGVVRPGQRVRVDAGEIDPVAGRRSRAVEGEPAVAGAQESWSPGPNRESVEVETVVSGSAEQDVGAAAAAERVVAGAAAQRVGARPAGDVVVAALRR